MENYKINEAKIENLEEITALVWEVFLEFQAPDYSEEGIAHFKEGLEYEQMRENLLEEGRKMWICCDEDIIIGVIRTRPPCHISLLFVRKEYHRKGIARSLFNEALKYYNTIGSIKEITVNSSPYAVKAYRQLGFVETNSEQVINGLRFTPMRALL
jgi:GNAT superfamily N-acetyltransferase